MDNCDCKRDLRGFDVLTTRMFPYLERTGFTGPNEALVRHPVGALQHFHGAAFADQINGGGEVG